MGHKLLRLSQALLLHLFTEGREVHCKITRGLPEGTQMVSSSYDHPRQTANLLLYHPTWPDTPIGEPYPDVLIVDQALKEIAP